MAPTLESEPVQTNGDVDQTTEEALKAQARYLQERQKRLGRDINQYRVVEGPFAHWLKDPWADEKPRDPISLETDVLILGGGYGSQLVAVELLKYGIENFTMVDKCGGFGGTWYWNRYPGAQCDIESFVYMPLLEETGYIPTEKYAHQKELLEHSERIARHYDLHRRAIFQTEVLSVHWEEHKGVWRIITDHDDSIYARFVVLNSGPLHRPKLPDTPGIEQYKGHTFHSSRWDTEYCGEDLSKLHDKRVAIIGTGATAVQIVPEVGRHAKELFVVQRTPSAVDGRLNHDVDSSWIEKNVRPGWTKSRRDNFNNMSIGGDQTNAEDLVDDNWTRVYMALANASKSKNPAAAVVRANYERMQLIRDRVDSVVTDPKAAAALKPWYNWGCKRPTFHDYYLPTFNRPNVHLIDTDGRGIEAFTEKGFMHEGREIEVDVIVFATGYELATDWVQRAGMDVYGRTQPVSQKWRDGYIGLHSWGSHGFPNAFWIHSAQAPFAVNGIFWIGALAEHIAYIIQEAVRRGLKYVEPSVEAEEEWLKAVLEAAELKKEFEEGCIPGYHNNEGNVTEKHKRNWWYAGSGLEYFDMLEKWRRDGDLRGLKLKEM